jgi:tetratricopeptide (TPR) repeat protein
MTGIFICYRKIERSYAPMLVDRELARRFGPGNVFQAGRSNAPGVHFPAEIDRRLRECTLLIALIDRPWVEEDLRLLWDERDWVRREISYALGHGKEVLPMLLDGAEMPHTRDVPDDIAALTRRIGLRMTPRTADADLLRLVGEVERLAPELVLTTLTDPEPPPATSAVALLRAEHRVFPWRQRPELEELVNWCLRRPGPPVRVLTGALGSGKTRLALRLCAQLRGTGWPAGLLSVSAPAEALDRLGEITGSCLVVIDDAESRPAQVRAALRSLAAAPDAYGRLLLLARSAGEWLDRLGEDPDDRVASLVDSVHAQTLEPLAPADGDLDTACAALAARLGLPVPPSSADLPTPGTLLEVQAAALVRLSPPDGPTEPPLRRILHLERDYWQRMAPTFDLPTLNRRNLTEIMAAVTLFGANTEPEADNLLSGLRAFRGGPVSARDSCRDLLRTVLPGPAALNPLRPEQLADDLAAELLRDGYPLADVLDHVSDEQAGTALIGLGRCIARHPDLNGPVAEFLTAVPRRLLPLAMTALPAVPRPEPLVAAMSLALDRVPAADLDRVVAVLPQRSEALARFAVTATERALAVRRSAGVHDVVTARLARLLATRLAYLGERSADAAESARSAIMRLTPLAGADAEPRAELAEAYAALALALDLDPASSAEALAAGDRAAGIYRSLPADDRYTTALAQVLHNQSVRLLRARRIDSAVVSATEAHKLVGPLHAVRPTRFRSLYADIVDNLSTVTAATGQRAGAERLSRQALALRRGLAADRPDGYRPQLAGTLFNLGLILFAGDRDRAEIERLWNESAALFESLERERPGRFSAQWDRVRRYLDRLAEAGG